MKAAIRELRRDRHALAVLGVGLVLLLSYQVYAYRWGSHVTRAITATCPQVHRSYDVTLALMERADPPFARDELAAYRKQRAERLKAVCS